MRYSRIFALLLAVCMTLGMVGGTVFAAGQEPGAPVDSFDSSPGLSPSGLSPAPSQPVLRPGGWQAPPFDFSASRLYAGANPRARAAFPSKYMLPDNVISPILDQYLWGTCWAFGALGSMESSLRRYGAAGSDLVFSPRHLAYFTFYDNPSSGPQDVTEGDIFLISPWAIEEYGEDQAPYQIGGNAYKATSILSRGIGAEVAEHVPYPTTQEFDSGLLGDYYRVDEKYQSHSHYQLQEANYLPDLAVDAHGNVRFDGSAIKNALLENGSVALGYNATAAQFNATGDPAYPYPTWYVDQPMNIDHCVQIVGWDDTIPKEYFLGLDGDHPAIDGAWIIQNSWGVGPIPGQGYFYLSYNDRSDKLYTQFLGDLTGENKPSYSLRHQYDGIGFTSAVSVPVFEDGTNVMANVFTAVEDERLEAVAFSTTGTDATYSIQIYTGGQEGIPDSGLRRLSVPQSGNIPYMGYHTVKLDQPVELRKGERFSVVIQIRNGFDDDYPVAIEQSFEGYCIARIDPGQSYIMFTNGWADLAFYGNGGNLCIKALANPMRRGDDNNGGGDDNGGRPAAAPPKVETTTLGTVKTTTTAWTDAKSGATVVTSLREDAATGKTERGAIVTTQPSGELTISDGVGLLRTGVPAVLSQGAGPLTPDDPLSVEIVLPTAAVASALRRAETQTVELEVTLPGALLDAPTIRLSALTLAPEVLRQAALLGKEVTVTVKNDSAQLLYAVTLSGKAMAQAAAPLEAVNLMARVSFDPRGKVLSFAQAGAFPGGSATVRLAGFARLSAATASRVGPTGLLEPLAGAPLRTDAKGMLTVELPARGVFVANANG